MKTVSCPRFLLSFRLFGTALVVLILSGHGSYSAPERIGFPFKNTSDFRGIYNVFGAFRQACLNQPVTPDLATELVPDGYKIVTSLFHLFGEDQGGSRNALILSKTGLEEDDLAGGHLIVSLTMPGDGRPNGRCSITWKRGWDYAGEHVPKVMDDTAARLEAHTSFRLAAFLTSKPAPSFQRAERYSLYSEWATGCWSENVCSFSLLAQLDPKGGMHLMLSREGVLREGTRAQE